MEIIDRRFLDTSTRSVHAATIEFWNGHPVFAWFGGSREGAQDVAIYIHNLNGDNGNIILGDKDNIPRWNPILYSHDGHLYLFEKAGIFCDRWQTFIHDVTNWKYNEKESRVRKNAIVLPCGLNGPVKTKPIVDEYLDGSQCDSVVCGSSVETFCDWTSYFEWYKVKDGKWDFDYRSSPICVDKVSYVDFSGRQAVSLGIIQPSLWMDKFGLNGLARSSYGLNNLFYIKCGYSMKPEIVETNLPNPNSGIDTVYVKGRLFLVSNPSSDNRYPLVVEEVVHNGSGKFESVDKIIIREKVDERDRGSCISQELSYPYMVENEGALHLVYTYGRSRIEYVTISI